MKKNNVTLIGMPGVGKSTVGVVLAKVLGYRFVDSDLEIQEQRSRQLLSQSEGLRHLRHDLHNQLQTAALLLEPGAPEEARSLLEQLWAALEPPPPEEGEENPHVQHSDL